MEKDDFSKKMYVVPSTEVMELETGSILTVSASPGGWTIDDGTSASKAGSGWEDDEY